MLHYFCHLQKVKSKFVLGRCLNIHATSLATFLEEELGAMSKNDSRGASCREITKANELSLTLHTLLMKNFVVFAVK